MKTFIIKKNGETYNTFKTVDENGNFKQWNEVKSNTGKIVKFNEIKKTIFEMGWKTLNDFLKSGAMSGYKVMEG